MAEADPRELLELAVAAARAAGSLLHGAMLLARTDVSTKSTGTDMVTEMDRAVEATILDLVLGARPDDAVVAEESGRREGSSGVRWIVDPLDGTTNYLYNHPGFAVSIGVERDGEVVAGVVLDVVHDELFTATRGGGATRNGEPIACSTQPVLAHALVATGFGYDATRRRGQAQQLAVIMPAIRDIRRMGAASVDLCSVACGRVDAYYERGLAEWDLAAGQLIAREAGAIVGPIEDGSTPAPHGSVVAAAPEIFEPLRTLIRTAEAIAAQDSADLRS